ncbi:hypothetical protein HK100_006996, partial [Physocladia obscura]
MATAYERERVEEAECGVTAVFCDATRAMFAQTPSTALASRGCCCRSTPRPTDLHLDCSKPDEVPQKIDVKPNPRCAPPFTNGHVILIADVAHP